MQPVFFMKYLEIHFNGTTPEQLGVLVAMLPEYGFSGMEELQTGIKAYAKEGDADLDAVAAIADHLGVTFSTAWIEEKNWNALWESNFDPVLIPGRVHVRAGFHPPAENVEHEIVITPKMSFGTGHHATTKMMMMAMLEMHFVSRSVIDFGTGTGILAILAEKLGAASVQAIDNDDWSVRNALENAMLNQSSRIRIDLASSLDRLEPADVLLANINRHVLEAQLYAIHSRLRPGGQLLISGLLQTDYEDMSILYGRVFGKPVSVLQEGGWIAMRFENRHSG